MHGVVGLFRYEKVEEAKRAMRKKAELEKRFGNGEAAGSSSEEEEDDDREDEDKITEQEEAGALPLHPESARPYPLSLTNYCKLPCFFLQCMHVACSIHACTCTPVDERVSCRGTH